jgi:hypothetical protein
MTSTNIGASTTYKVTFDRPVCVKGALYGGPQPFKASYLTTGEGGAFKRVIPGSSWDKLDIRLYHSQTDASAFSLPIKVAIVVPKGWDTLLLLALIVDYVRDHDTLRFECPSGRIRDVFEWFMQEPENVARFLADKDVYKSIEVEDLWS